MTTHPWLLGELELKQRAILAEVARDRLADRATGPGRSLRARLADALRTLADSLDQRPARLPTPQLDRA